MPINLQEDRTLAQRPRLQEACLKLHDMAQGLGADAKLPTMVGLRSQLGISVQARRFPTEKNKTKMRSPWRKSLS